MSPNPLLFYPWLILVLPVIIFYICWSLIVYYSQWVRNDVVFVTQKDYNLLLRSSAVRAIPACMAACLTGYGIGLAGLGNEALWLCGFLINAPLVYIWFHPTNDAILPAVIVTAVGMAAAGGIYTVIPY